MGPSLSDGACLGFVRHFQVRFPGLLGTFRLQPLAFLNEYVEVSSGTVFIRQKGILRRVFRMGEQGITRSLPAFQFFCQLFVIPAMTPLLMRFLLL